MLIIISHTIKKHAMKDSELLFINKKSKFEIENGSTIFVNINHLCVLKEYEIFKTVHFN